MMIIVLTILMVVYNAINSEQIVLIIIDNTKTITYIY